VLAKQNMNFTLYSRVNKAKHELNSVQKDNQSKTTEQ